MRKPSVKQIQIQKNPYIQKMPKLQSKYKIAEKNGQSHMQLPEMQTEFQCIGKINN